MQCGHLTVATSSNSPHPHPLGASKHHDLCSLVQFSSLGKKMWDDGDAISAGSLTPPPQLGGGGTTVHRKPTIIPLFFTFHNILSENSSNIRLKLRIFLVRSCYTIEPYALTTQMFLANFIELLSESRMCFTILMHMIQGVPNGTTHLTSYLLQLIMS